MKIKATKKEIRNGYSNIIKLGYCDLQQVLKYLSPFAYSSGVNGWACDYYKLGGICISTGYNSIGNITIPYDEKKEFETIVFLELEKITNYDEKKEKATLLLHDFLKKYIWG